MRNNLFFRGTLCFLVLLLGITWPATAAIESNGAVDMSFDPGKFTNGQVSTTVFQPRDGKLLIGGNFTKVNGVSRRNIARLNPDGSLDLSFNPGSGPDGEVTGIVLHPDGRILITGFFSSVNGSQRVAQAARLNTDGSLEPSFDPGKVLGLDTSDTLVPGQPDNPGSIASLVVQADGRIVVTGSFAYAFTGVHTTLSRACIARFKADGTFDSTFDPGTGLTYSVDPSQVYGAFLVQQSSGKLILEGAFDKYDGNFTPGGMARLEVNGAFDGTFNPGTAASFNNVAGMFVQADDAIVVYGNFLSFNGTPVKSIVRLDKTTGAVDGGFATGSFKDYADTGTVQGVTQQSDGKLIVTGAFHSLDSFIANGIARLETDGTRDGSLDSSVGCGPNGYTYRADYRASDGAIAIGGYFSTFGGALRNNIVLIKNNGAIEPGFAPSEGAIDGFPQILAVATQPDGKVLVGGIFTSVQGEPHYNFVRLNANGSIDPTFDVTLGTSRSVRRMELLPDGNILIAGQFGAINGVPRGRVARLKPDGTVDPAFDPGTGANDIIYGLARDSAGNVYIGGAFTSVNGTPRARLAKLSSTGVLDPTFDPGVGTGPVGTTSADVRALAPPTASAGLVVAGIFNSYQGVSANRIFRCDANTAARDTSFNYSGATPGSSFNSFVRNVIVQPDGKYVATGSFTTYNGTSRPRLARLNANGSLDTTFVRSPVVSNGSGFGLALQNTKLYVGGSFTGAGAVGRLFDTGANDSVFDPGTGPTVGPPFDLNNLPQVNVVYVEAGGKVMVGGSFTLFNGQPRYGLVRLTDSRYVLGSVVRLPNGHFTLAGFGPPNSFVTILVSSTPSASGFMTLATVPTDARGAFSYEDVPPPGAGARFYQLAAP